MSATSTAPQVAQVAQVAAQVAAASHPSQYSRMLEMRDNEETMNVGKKWTIEEDIKLAQEIAENKTFEEIATEHKRTTHAIELRVISHIIYPKIKDNLDVNMEEVALKYNVDTSQLIRQINKIIIKGEPKPKQKEYLPTNKDILEYLKKLDSKMDEINSKLDNLEYLR
jgi:hypothetical protein